MLKKILRCAILSMTPVVELRAALPAGIAMGLSPWLAYAVCVLANMMPVPIIILFLRPVLDWMRKRGGFFYKLAHWVDGKAEKNMKMYRKYELLGLFVLVAIPLPGTGAWTGALVASFLDMRLKRAVPVIFAGVATAGLLMLIFSLGVIKIVT